MVNCNHVIKTKNSFSNIFKTGSASCLLFYLYPSPFIIFNDLEYVCLINVFMLWSRVSRCYFTCGCEVALTINHRTENKLQLSGSTTKSSLTIGKPSCNLLVHGAWVPFGTPRLPTLPIVGHAQGTWPQYSMRSGTHYD